MRSNAFDMVFWYILRECVSSAIRFLQLIDVFFDFAVQSYYKIRSNGRIFPKKNLKPRKYLANNSFFSTKSDNFAAANRSTLAFWRGARVVEEARLESV